MASQLEKFSNFSLQIILLLFFGFCLTIPSAYTWSAGLISLLSIFHLTVNYKKIFQSIDKCTSALILIFLLMGLLWWHDFNTLSSFNDGRLGIKYVLAALSLIVLLHTPSHDNYIKTGVLIGGIPLLFLSIHQFINLDRATGFTNAIQFGGISTIFLGFSLIYLTNSIIEKNKNYSILLILSAIGFLGSSLLSLSRGGWIFFALIPFLIIPLLNFNKHGLLKFFTVLLVITGSLFATPIFQNRLKTAFIEAKDYSISKEDASLTSIGQRLEQWKSALLLIEDNLFFGTGELEYEAKKQALVDRNIAHPSITNYGHAHNEILDMTSRRGLVGLSLLIAFYLIPFFIFAKKFKDHRNNKRIAELSLMGASIPLGYFIFGLTQVFFAHNSGNLFYLFGIVFIYTAIRKIEIKEGMVNLE